MSVVFVVVPAVVAGWPVLCGAIAGAAGALGYKALKTNNENLILDENPLGNSVEIPIEGSQIVAETMQRESKFVICKDDVTATFTREADGRCCVHVTAKNRSDQELQSIGKELVGRVTQQYAYNKVLTELKNQGFSVTNEEVANDQTIRIRVSKYV
jgi:hypothetical protein